MSNSIYESVMVWYDSILMSPYLNTYLAIAGGLVALYFVFLFVIPLFLHQMRKFAEKTHNDFDDILIRVLTKIKWPLFFILILYAATFLTGLPDVAEKVIKIFLMVFITYEAVKAANIFVQYGFDKYTSKGIDKEGVMMMPVLVKVIKACVWGLGIVTVLSNLGYHVTTLITGLGIGGIAIALAVQNILSDLFSSFSIYFDKPFKIGDFIVVDKIMGNVKHIGIKTTRITSLDGEELVIPNSKLVNATIQNYKKMKDRRIEFHIGVVYETKPAKLKKVPGLIKQAFKGIRKVEFSRAHFEKFGDFSLDFEVIYVVKTNDYAEYMDIQQKINYNLVDLFAKEKIEFAYPTQKIFIEK